MVDPLELIDAGIPVFKHRIINKGTGLAKNRKN